MRVIIFSPLIILHKTIVISSDPDAKYYPFGENATFKTGKEWPVRVLMNFKVDKFSSFKMLDTDLGFSFYSLGNRI